MKIVSPLNYLDYDREEAKKIFRKEFGWKDYGRKHHESIWTKFYQSYILPEKFGVDKRRAHFSTLICSGQMTREQALKELKKPVYDKAELQRDKEYVLKKFGLSEQEFEKLMKLPIKKHTDYPSNEWIYLILRKARGIFLGDSY